MEKVSSVMAANVVTVRPEATVEEAAEKMRALNIGALPVSEEDHVSGMITDRDIVTRAVAEQRDFGRTTVGEIMTHETVFCFEEDDLSEALKLMRTNRVGRLLVLDENRKLKGLLTLGAVTRHLGKDHLSGLLSERVSARNRSLTVGFSAVAGVATLLAGLGILRVKKSSEQSKAA